MLLARPDHGGIQPYCFPCGPTCTNFAVTLFRKSSCPPPLSVLALLCCLLVSVHAQQVGRVVSWGHIALPDVRPGTRYKSIAAGFRHCLAVTEDGKVVAWGQNGEGQSTVPADLNGVASVAAGMESSLALTKNGVVAFLPGGLTSDLTNVSAVASGSYQSLILKKDGTVTAFGYYYYAADAIASASVPAGLKDVAAVAGGMEHSLALRRDGTVVAWNETGFLPVPAGLTNVLSISAGAWHCLALAADGRVVEWNSWATVPSDLGRVVAIAAGWDHSLALKDDGTVVGWNEFGKTPVPAGLKDVISIAAGGTDLALTKNGELIAWGGYPNFVPADLENVRSVTAGGDILALRGDGTVLSIRSGVMGPNEPDIEPGGLTDIAGVSAEWFANFALTKSGEVMAWGQNGPSNAIVPLGLNGVIALASGAHHTTALKRDGTVVSWDDDGSLYQLAWVTNVMSIAAGSYHDLALKADGTVIAWGSNDYGETIVPEGLTGVIAVAAGNNRSLALKRDGSIVYWGFSSGMNPPRELSNAVAIATSDAGDAALKADGTVVTWGGDPRWSTPPPNLNRAIAVAAGPYYQVAIVADAPTLGISSQANHQVLTWPIWARDWRLETGQLSSGALRWAAVTNTAFIQGNSYTVTTSSPEKTGFYRLTNLPLPSADIPNNTDPHVPGTFPR